MRQRDRERKPSRILRILPVSYSGYVPLKLLFILVERDTDIKKERER